MAGSLQASENQNERRNPEIFWKSFLSLTLLSELYGSLFCGEREGTWYYPVQD